MIEGLTEFARVHPASVGFFGLALAATSWAWFNENKACYAVLTIACCIVLGVLTGR